MWKAFKRTMLYFWYEIIVLGVIYEFLVVLRVLNKNLNGPMVIFGLAIIFLCQWGYFLRKLR